MNDDKEAFRKVTHDLKGLGGGHGFPGLSELAGRIEFDYVKQDREAIARNFDELDIMLKRIYSGVSEELAQM